MEKVLNILQKICKEICSLLLSMYKESCYFIRKVLRITKFDTATSILLNLADVEYKEPSLDYTMNFGDILSILENRYEQIAIDKALNLIDDKTFNSLLRDFKKDFEMHRSDYILKLEVARI